GRLIRTFTNPSPTVGEQFGAAVAAGANGLLLIGAPFNDSPGAENAGAAYLFDGDPARGEFGGLLKTFRKPDPRAGDLFGAAVAGAVYLFGVDGKLQPFFNPSPEAADRFGAAVALTNEYVAVGAPGDDSGAHDAGIAYGFNACNPCGPTRCGNFIVESGEDC